jgi:hypothetical protein
VTIGNGAFSSLFDLSNSSALAILIDTSGSMSGEIEAVKAEVIQIIEVNSFIVYPTSYPSVKENNLQRESLWSYIS